MRESMVAAGFSDAMFDGGIQDLWDLFWGQGWSGTASAISSIGSAKAATDAWLESAYGSIHSQTIGGAINFTLANFWTGSSNGEQILPDYSNILTDNDNLHGGGGDDDLFGSLGLDLIDGGQGYDTANFATQPIRFRESTVYIQSYSSDIPYSATVNFLTEGGSGLDGVSDLYDVEKLVLGEHSDLVIVFGDSHLQLIDGSGGNEEGRDIAIQGYSEMAVDTFRSYGDTLQLESLNTGTSSEVRVVLSHTTATGADEGYLSTGSFTLTVNNFEDVVGTGIRDVVSGSQVSNYLFGMSGDDLLVGEGATDFLDGGDGNDVLYGGTWAGIDQSGPGADPTDYEDDGVKDYLVGGTGVEKYYASAFDEITDATIHAVEEAAAAGPAAGEQYARFVADGDGEVYFDGRLLTGGERIAFGQWDRYPPTPSLNIMVTDANGNYVQQALFVDKNADQGPLYYRIMNAYTYASDGTRVDEWLLIVEDPVAGTAITITGANFTPGASLGEGFLGLSGSSAVLAASSTFMSLAAVAGTSGGQPQTAAMYADAFESLGGGTGRRPDLRADSATNTGLGTATASGEGVLPGHNGVGIGTGGNPPGGPNTGSGGPGTVIDLSVHDSAALTTAATTSSTSGGFLGISIVEPVPAPDTAGNDLIRGTNGNDTLTATEGNDTLKGSGGNDLLNGGWDADSLDGGSGTDTATYVSSNAGVQVYLYAGSGTGGHAQGDKLTSIENVTDSGYADSLYGTSGNNILIGQAGNDYFEGRGGIDWFDGGNGNDAVGFAYSSTSFVTVNLGTGTFGGLAAGHTYISIESFGGTSNAAQGDTLIGSDGRNDLYGYAGNDVISGAGGNDLLNGGDGADTIDGGTGNDVIQGATGADRLTGGAGFDLFSFALGDTGSLSGAWDIVTDFNEAEDFIEISASAGFRWIGTDAFEAGLPAGLPYDLRYEIVGSDTQLVADTNRDGIADMVVVLNGIHALDATDFYNTVVQIKSTAPVLGTTGDDVIDGTAYGDLIDGLAGNDTISGQGSGDNISGGDGNDRVLGGDGNDTIHGGLGLDTLFGDAGMDELHGGDGNDTIYSLADNDMLFGDAGNDSLMGGRGNDALHGGIDNDSLYGETGDDLLFGEDGDDVLHGDSTFEWVENTRYVSSPGNDTLYGGAGNDRLYGDAYDNEAPGNDFLYGGDGNDTLSGGLGTNYFDGGTGYDILDLSDIDDTGLPGSGSVVVDMVAQTYTRADNSVHSFINMEGVETTSYNDVVYGDSGSNWIDTATGDDTVYGGAGDDVILGSIGADYFDGGTGNDTLDFSYTTTGATFDLVSGTVTFVGGQVETALAFESVIAGSGADRLTGTSAANELVGNAGNDTLIGGAGDDSLTGGLGADQFVFTSTASGMDVITDFNELNGGGEEGDVLRFEGLGVGTFAYLGAGSFSGGSDNSEARVSGSQVLVDTNGDGTSDITITLAGLTNASQLSVSDFVFV
jgi:Ca2+-binding RTX toxin-like protein